MKLLCINDKGWWSASFMIEKGPKYGDIVTEGEGADPGYVKLLEYPGDKEYKREAFIPISDIEETEYSEKIMEDIFQPVNQ